MQDFHSYDFRTSSRDMNMNIDVNFQFRHDRHDRTIAE